MQERLTVFLRSQGEIFDAVEPLFDDVNRRQQLLRTPREDTVVEDSQRSVADVRPAGRRFRRSQRFDRTGYRLQRSDLIACRHLRQSHGADDLSLWSNDLTSLPAGIFDKTTALRRIILTALRRIILNGNGLTALPSGIFDKTTALTNLYLKGLIKMPASARRSVYLIEAYWAGSTGQFDWPASTGPELRREFSIRGSCVAVH